MFIKTVNGENWRYLLRNILIFILLQQDLHYGQEAFEGLKAYLGRDGRIRLFRWEENAKRMISSAEGIKMAVFPLEKFREALFKVIQSE